MTKVTQIANRIRICLIKCINKQWTSSNIYIPLLHRLTIAHEHTYICLDLDHLLNPPVCGADTGPAIYSWKFLRFALRVNDRIEWIVIFDLTHTDTIEVNWWCAYSWRSSCLLTFTVLCRMAKAQTMVAKEKRVGERDSQCQTSVFNHTKYWFCIWMPVSSFNCVPMPTHWWHSTCQRINTQSRQLLRKLF